MAIFLMAEDYGNLNMDMMGPVSTHMKANAPWKYGLEDSSSP